LEIAMTQPASDKEMVEAVTLAEELFKTDWPNDKWGNHQIRGTPDAAARRYVKMAETAIALIRRSPADDTQKDEPMLSKDMPAPDTRIEYADGSIGMAMFHYAAEGQNLEHIASEHGFDCEFRELEGDDSPGAEELFEKYSDGANGDEILKAWQPKVPDGWTLAAKYDTEDGPAVMFVRKMPLTDPPAPGSKG
jgi:hypothetical protein